MGGVSGGGGGGPKKLFCLFGHIKLKCGIVGNVARATAILFDWVARGNDGTIGTPHRSVWRPVYM